MKSRNRCCSQDQGQCGTDSRIPKNNLFLFCRRLVNLFGVCLFVVCLFQCSHLSQVEAACLLAYDEGATLKQGDALARISFQTGQAGLGSHLEARLGLPGHRSLFLRSGACQGNSLWGWAIEGGLKQNFLSFEETGIVDLGVRLGINALLADTDDESYSELGLQPSLLISYPFQVTQQRGGFVSLGLGLNAYFIDRRDHQIIDQNDGNILEEAQFSSRLDWSPLVSLASSIDVLPFLPLALEIRWQQQHIYGGASIAYLF